MHQITLDRKSNSATIDLNVFFYPVHILHQSSAEFKEIAGFDIISKANRAIVTIFPKDNSSAEQAALHFCNFALALKRELGEHA
jgi:hypothetical protein